LFVWLAGSLFKLGSWRQCFAGKGIQNATQNKEFLAQLGVSNYISIIMSASKQQSSTVDFQAVVGFLRCLRAELLHEEPKFSGLATEMDGEYGWKSSCCRGE
jgi:hypothetical protein